MTFIQIWLLPIALLVTATVVAFPLSRYMAWIMDGKYRPWRFSAGSNSAWTAGRKTGSSIYSPCSLFNTLMFVFGFLVLALQPWTPLNPRGLTLLAPSTIFNSVVSFMTNTDLQHYSGDQHLSNFSQIFFGIFNLFLSAAIGLARWPRSSAPCEAIHRSATSSSICGVCWSTCSCPPLLYSASFS